MPVKSSYPDKIISYLQQNPTASRKDIQEYLNCSYAAVQKHLKKLEDDQKVKPGFIVNQEEIDRNNFTYWIMIHTNYTYELEKEFEEGNHKDDFGKDYQARLRNEIKNELLKDNWSKDISLRSINIVFSAPWDIILSVNSKSAEVVGHFITQYLRTHHAIDDTNTAWSSPVL